VRIGESGGAFTEPRWLRWTRGDGAKRKRFQVTRITASPTAGMHGIELRSQERRTSHLSAPRPAVSPPAGSMPPGTPQPFRSLLPGTGNSKRPFPRPQRLPLSRTPFRGQIALACPFVSCAAFPRPVRSFAPLPAAVCSVRRLLLCSDPLPVPCCARPAVAPVSTPLQDFYFPPDQSVLPDKSPVSPPSEFARSPLAPRFRFYL